MPPSRLKCIMKKFILHTYDCMCLLIICLFCFLGFGPFSGHDVNASWECVKLLGKLGLGDDVTLVTYELPVEYATVRAKVPEIWDKHKPDVSTADEINQSCFKCCMLYKFINENLLNIIRLAPIEMKFGKLVHYSHHRLCQELSQIMFYKILFKLIFILEY